MLARYLRRPAPVRYANIPREAMPSVQFGLKSLGRMAGLPHALDYLNRVMRSGSLPAGGVARPVMERLGSRPVGVLAGGLRDLLHTGHPAALMAMLDLLHGDADLPTPSREDIVMGDRGGISDPGRFLRALHGMHAQTNVAGGEPLHPLRQYTPELLHGEQAANDYLSLDPTVMQDYPEVSGLHPILGGPGLAGLHDAHDLARMEGRTLSNYRPSPAAYLGQLISSLHHGLTETAGREMRRRNTQGGR